ncbi:12026_t:CDS:2 [Entrophospora sp. SA101]|nr:12026_t:CDS:2 [Entrophospora sp. SA101]
MTPLNKSYHSELLLPIEADFASSNADSRQPIGFHWNERIDFKKYES